MLALLFLIFPYKSHASDYAVNMNDSRVPSKESRVARLSSSIYGGRGCSGALIGKTCMLTAGHCADMIVSAEFNTRGARKYTGLKSTRPEDIYMVDRKSISKFFKYAGGEDWAVFRLKKHKRIGKYRKRIMEKQRGIDASQRYLRYSDGYYAGELQGFYETSFSYGKVGDLISITGYGNAKDIRLHNTQQSADGIIMSKTEYPDVTMFFHSVDVENGNSGSGIYSTDLNKLIGIHTFSRCNVVPDNGFCKNGGLLFQGTPKLQNAINKCLQWEREHLY